MDHPHSFPELVEQYHAAIEVLHQSRAEWEKTLTNVEFRYQERVDAARQKLVEAEHAMEELEQRISQALSKPN